MNRNVKRAGRTVLSGALIFGLIFGNSSFTEAKRVKKQESVYVNAGAGGETNKITVADWLQDSGVVGGTLSDSSDLTDIVNVKGEETFVQSGDKMDWTTAGKDIFYQGQSSKELPVELKITYSLDGQEMAPQDMAGKSGKVEIHVSYKNKSVQKKKINGEMADIYTPFVMVTGMILPAETFDNVKIDRGRVINDGSNNIVVGLGTPGLSESLDLKNEFTDEITDELSSDFTVTADVTEFEMGNTFTYGSPSLLDELNVDEIGDPEKLEKKLDDLIDAAGKLVDGSSELSDNMKIFADKMGELEDSVKEYRSSGVSKLTDGISALADGGKELKKGVRKYTSGVAEFANGSRKYIAGADKIAKGNKDLYDAVKVLPAQLEQFAAGLETYTSGVDKLGTKENAEKLKSGTAAVSNGISAVNEGLTQLKETYANNTALIEGLKKTVSMIPDTEAFAELKKTQSTLLGQMEALTAGQKAAVEKLEAATGKDSELKGGADLIAASVAVVMDALTLLSSNSSTLTEAAKKLNDSVPTLVSSIKALRDGGVTLTKNDKKLLSGAKALLKAGKVMNKSVKKMKGGITTLNRGGGSLNRATDKLVSGVEKLNDASGKLSDGSDKLGNGMDKFNKKGVTKLNNLYNDDIREVLDRIDAVIDAGKEYRSFSGLGVGMDGEVKFIIETEEIKKDE